MLTRRLQSLTKGTRFGALLAFIATMFFAGLVFTQGPPPGQGGPPTAASGGASSVLLPSGLLLVTGGADANGPTTGASLLSLSGTVSPAASLRTARQNHISILLQDGRVLVAGGTTTGGGITNAAEIYNPATNSWSVIASGMTEARSGAAAVVLKDGRVLISGGRNSASVVSSTLEIFNPATGTFVFAGTLSTPRTNHAATVLVDGRVVIAGGSNGSAVLASLDIFNPGTRTVTPGPAMASARAGLWATTLLQGDVFLVGGNDGQRDLSSAEIFNPKTGTLRSAPAMGAARRNLQAIRLPNNNAVLILPGSSSGFSITDAEVFIPWQNRFRPLASLLHSKAKPRGAASGGYATQRLTISGAEDDATDAASATAEGRYTTLADQPTAADTAEVCFPTLTSDKPDYAPGETVILTGTCWAPGETVTIGMHVDPTTHEDVTLTSTADASGSFTNSDYVVQESDLGVTFTVTSTGNLGSTAQILTFTDATNTDTAISSSANPSTSGDSVTFTATVTNHSGGAAITQGTVDFKTGGSNCAGATAFASGVGLNGSGQATASTTFTNPPATVTVRACYNGFGSGGSAINPSNASLTQTVNAQAFSINDVTANEGDSGTTNFTFTVTKTGAGAANVDYATANGTTNPATGGASCTVGVDYITTSGTLSFLTGDTTKPITVSVCGDTTVETDETFFVNLSNATGGFTISDNQGLGTITNDDVAAKVGSVTLGSQVGTPTYGTAGSAAYSVTVDRAASGSFDATLCLTTSLPAGATASFGTNPLAFASGDTSKSTTLTINTAATTPAGATPFTLRASNIKGGQTCLTADDSKTDSKTLTVNKADTTTGVSSSANPSVFGQSVSFTATLTPSSATGTVQFKIDGADFGAPVALSGGSATSGSTSSLAIGNHTVSAVYSGDSNFNTSTGNLSPDQTVNKAGTTTAITSDTPDPSKVGQAYAVNFTVTANAPGSGTPTGNVTVSDGTDSCVGTVAAGTCSLTSTAAGAKTLTATYAGDTNFNGSSGTTAHQVDKADTTISITSDAPDPSVVGQSYTVKWSFAVSAPGAGSPTGTVTVSGGSGCSAAVAAGQCDVTSDTAGAKTLTATYAGDSNFNGSASAGEPHQVDKANTSTAVTSSVNPSVFGQSVSFTATVTPASGSGPTGTVQFKIDGADFGAPVALSGGSATSGSTSSLAVGNHTVSAVYGGDTNFNTSTGNLSPDQTVSKATTTTSVTSSQNPSVFGQSVTFTATVAVVAPGAGTPTGNVQFYDGASPLGSPVALGGSTAALTTSALSVATHSITAKYLGDTSFNDSTSSALSQVVNKAETTTTITSDAPDPSVVGQPYTVGVTVAAVAPGAGTPTGTVTVNGGSSCTATLTGGSGSCTMTSTSAGAKTLTADYAGDGNFNISTSTGEPHQVNKADTSTVVSSSANPSVFGQLLTYTATVSVVAPGAGSPTGSVEFFDGLTSLGTGSLSGSTATLSTSALSVATHSITAKYLGDTNFNSSTSGALSQVVSKADTSTSVTSSANPSKFGQSVTFTATVSVTAPGAGTPTGTVTFKEGATTLGTGSLSGNQATFTTSALAVGSHSITAEYGGESNFNGSTGALTQTVDKADTSTSITSDTPDPSVVGQPYTVSFTVGAVAPGSGTPAGTVNVSDGNGGSCSATLPATNCSITSPSAGAKTLTATYGGDGNFNGSASAGEPHTVSKADTTTTITSDAPDPSVVGQTYTVKWTVTVNSPGAGTPTGTVTITGGSTCSALVAAGQCNVTSTSAGAKTLTATYSGDSNFNGSSDTESHQVDKADTSTSVSSSANPSVFGQSVTFTATVSVTAPGAGSPTGTVQFKIDGSDFGAPVALSGGSATTSTSSLAVGNHTVSAVYSSDTDFNGSTGALAGGQTASKADTTTTITSDNPDPSVTGQSYTVKWTVTVNSPGAGTLSGTVTVTGGSTCSAPVAAGQCDVTSTTAGAKTLTATYSGDGSFNGSSGTTAHQVNKASTTTTIISDTPDPTVVGQGYTVNWTVTVNSPGSGTPTGTVSVSDGNGGLCSAAVGAGTCSLASTSAGAKTLTATYAGDSDFNGSSGTTGHQVDQADTTTGLLSSANPSVYGQSVMFTATVSVVSPGAGTPTGSVTFFDGLTPLGTAGLVGNTALLITPTLSVGSHSITAVYSSDANFKTSTGGLTEVVNKASSTTTITSDLPDPSLAGQPYTVNFTVAPQYAGTPTGTVTVSDGSATCTGTLTAGAGSCSLTSTTAGAKTLTATYAGDANFNPSTSAGEPHTVYASARITVFSALHTIGKGSSPDSKKTALELDLKVFDKSLLKAMSPENFDNIWTTTTQGGLVYDKNNKLIGNAVDLTIPNGLTPAKAFITKASQFTQPVGGGYADVYNILVPAAGQWGLTGEYVVIGRSCFNGTTVAYPCTPPTGSTYTAVYPGSPTDPLAANSTTQKHLKVSIDGNGKIKPMNTTEVPGSLLLVSEPVYLEYTSDTELLPIVYESVEGYWESLVRVDPPEGFIATPGTLDATVNTGSVDVTQFTVKDVGSDWSYTTITHRLKHNGKLITIVSRPKMINKQAPKPPAPPRPGPSPSPGYGGK